jgi:hypothetical protein
MVWTPIIKVACDLKVAPNLADYERCRTDFTWDQARQELEGLPQGRGLNIAHEAVDRHAAGPRRDKVAFRWLGKDGARCDDRDLHSRNGLQEFRKTLSNGPGFAVSMAVQELPQFPAIGGDVPEYGMWYIFFQL